NPSSLNEHRSPAAGAGTLQLGELTVRRMGFGAMRVTTDGGDIWGPPADPRTAKLLLHRALELGINFFDTADSYGPHASESFIAWYPLGDGAALRSRGVKQLARRLGLPPAQVALAWLLAHSRVMLPMPGTASIAHLEENTAAAALRIPPEDLAALN